MKRDPVCCVHQVDVDGDRYMLRARPAMRDALGNMLGLALPERIGATAAAGGWRALMLGPDEWWLERTEANASPLAQSALPHTSIVDISHRDVEFRIDGPAAADVLACGIARNLGAIAPGHGCRTVFDDVGVLLLREADDAFRVAVARSFAPYLAARLDQALREILAGAPS